LCVSESKIAGAGRGVFTSTKIQKGEIIAEYFGTYHSKETKFSKPESDYVYSFTNDYQINPDKECIAAYINDTINIQSSIYHGRRVNLDLIHNVDWLELPAYMPVGYAVIKLYIRAKKDIEIGEELYIDYGDGYWNSRIKKRRFIADGDTIDKAIWRRKKDEFFDSYFNHTGLCDCDVCYDKR